MYLKQRNGDFVEMDGIMSYSLLDDELKKAIQEKERAVAKFDFATTAQEVDVAIMFIQAAETKISAIIQNSKGLMQ